MEKGYWKIAAAAAFLAAAGLFYGFSARSMETIPPESLENPSETEALTAEEPTEAKLYVYVCGEVEAPGVYELLPGSRIFEAVERAGGFTKEASPESLNLAAEVSDGMKLKVYSKAEAETAAQGAEFKESEDGRVNLNTAAKAELITLPGIGESRAEDIIRYREESGGFQTIEDIMKVPGIKDAGFQKIKDRITV